MINLLPPQQKEELKEEEKSSLFLVLEMIILAFLVSLILILFAIQIPFSAELEQQKAHISQKNEELKGSSFPKLEEEIKKYNLIFSQLETFYKNQPDLTLTLDKIFQFFPKGIYFTGLNFNPQTLQVSLSGFSPNSETLVQFEKNMKSNKGLEEVVFDPADWWLKTTDINFTVKFKIERQ